MECQQNRVKIPRLRAPLTRKPLGGPGARSDAREGAAGDAVKSVGARNLLVSRHRNHHVPPGTRATSFSRPVTRVRRSRCESQTAAWKGVSRRAPSGHVMEWWSLYRAELAENWRLAQEGREPKAIEPLE